MVGFTAGNALIRGIKMPSVFVGAAILVAGISNCACGVVVPTPTWAVVMEAESNSNKKNILVEVLFINLKM